MPPVEIEHRGHGDALTRPHLGPRGAQRRHRRDLRALQHLDVDGGVPDTRLLEAIVDQEAEHAGGVVRQGHVDRLTRVGAGVEVLERHRRVAIDVETTAQRQRRGGVELDAPHQAVGGRDRKQDRRPGPVAHDGVVEVAPAPAGGDPDADRDGRSFAPHLADYRRQTVLDYRADRRRGVGDLEGRGARREGQQDLGLRHRHLQRAGPQHRVTEGEHAVPVDVGQGADADDVHVARRERRPDGGARQQGQRGRRRRGAAAGRRLQPV